MKHEPVKLRRRLPIRSQITYGLLFGLGIVGLFLACLYVFWMRVMPGVRFLGYAPTGTEWLFKWFSY